MRNRGFSLIELMIGLALAVILILLAAPNYAIWTADAQIRNGVESLAAGMRFAHAEAVKRNTPIEFILDPTTATGGWQVNVVGVGVIRTGLFSEAATRVTYTVTPGGATTVTFTGLGAIAPNADTSASLTEIAATNADGIPNTRPLTLLVGGGRSGIKICDPAITDTTSPRFCTV